MRADLNNLDSVIDKYQTGLFSTTYDSPTDAISDCLNVNRVRKRIVWPSFFLIAAVVYRWWFFGFFSVIAINIFCQLTKLC